MMSNIPFKKRKIVPERIDRPEVLLDNAVTTDVQNLFLPLNILQKFAFSTKFYIRDNFIFPIGWKTKVLSFIYTSVIIFLFGRRAVVRLMTKFYKDKNAAFSFFTVLNHLFSAMGHVVTFVSNIKNTNLNVSFVISIQKIFKSLSYNKIIIRYFTLWNWFYCIMTLIFFHMLYDLLYVTTEFVIQNFIVDFSLIVFDSNAVSSVRHITLIKNFVFKWFEDIKTSKSTNVKVDNQHCKKIFETYVTILKTYEMCIEEFQDKMIFWIIDTFGHSLIYLQMMLTRGQEFNIKSFIIYSLVLWWMVKHIALVAILVAEIEKIHILMEKIQINSIKVIETRGHTEAERRMHKNILRLHRYTFVNANARGLFNLDATLPLGIGAQITTYSFVLLQFALVS